MRFCLVAANESDKAGINRTKIPWANPKTGSAVVLTSAGVAKDTTSSLPGAKDPRICNADACGQSMSKPTHTQPHTSSQYIGARIANFDYVCGSPRSHDCHSSLTVDRGRVACHPAHCAT
jgi:hypothetical protein